MTYVGTVPNPVLAASIAGFAAGSERVRWSDLPDSATVLSAVNPAGRRLWFLHNWSGDPVDMTAPIAATDVLRKTPVAPGESIHLAARDVRVLREEA